MSDYFDNLRQIVEAAIFAADEPLAIDRLQALFSPPFVPEASAIQSAIEAIQSTCEDRGVELVKVASGYRFQAKAEYATWLQKIWERKPPRYSRAVLETLALIAYRQPITRGEIEDVRGVAVSSDIIKKLLEREWIKVVGVREAPGKPVLYATTKQFLDYFNLEKLSQLPTLDEIRDLEEIGESLGMQLSLEPIEPIKSAAVSIEEITQDDLAKADELIETVRARDEALKAQAEQAELEAQALAEEI